MKLILNGRFLTQHVTGVQRVARELLTELDSLAELGRIPVPRLLVPASSELVEPPVLKAMAIEPVGRFSGHLWEQLELPKAVKGGVLMCLGNTAPLIRLYSKAGPTLVMVHDLSYKYFPAAYSTKFKVLYGFLMPRILKRAEKVVTVSRAEMEAIQAHYPFIIGDQRFEFAQNGGLTDSDAAKAYEGDLPGYSERSYGIYVGSLTKRKNAKGMLLAAIRFLRRYRDMTFVVIGGTDASFEEFDLNVPEDIKDRLNFWGQVNDKEKIYSAYRGARFLLFPSFYEASPLPPIEAMTFGCPVIASTIPSLEERCGNAALYCDPEDDQSIDSAINKLMESDAKWNAYSSESMRWSSQFTWKAQLEALLEVCESVNEVS